MSSVAAAPAAPAVHATRARRPSTLTVYRWELRKLVSQKRTYMGLGLAMILPLIFVIVPERAPAPRSGGGQHLRRQITQSGLATPVLMLLFLSVFMLPLIASLVAGDIVAAEDGNGTLKTILTRSVDRGQVFAAKVLAALTYATIAVFLSAAVATVGGVASWGFNQITTFSGTVVSRLRRAAARVRGQRLLSDPAVHRRRIGVLLSTATRNSTAAVVGAVGLVILLYIVAGIPGLEGIKPYLLTEQFENWHGLLRTPTDWAPITHSLWVCALYAGPALFAAYLVFLRRDVAGG